MLASLRDGCRSVGLNWGLVLLVLVTNLGFALVVAVPLAFQLEAELEHRGASSAMMYGFDYDWWSLWSEQHRGPESALGPDLLGTGFALKNLELLLQGWLPAGLFARGADRPPVDPLILALGLGYLVLQAFLTGGITSAFRRPRGGWSVRGLVHGCGFYFGRMLRLSLLALAGVGVVFALNVPVRSLRGPPRARGGLGRDGALAHARPSRVAAPRAAARAHGLLARPRAHGARGAALGPARGALEPRLLRSPLPAGVRAVPGPGGRRRGTPRGLRHSSTPGSR